MAEYTFDKIKYGNDTYKIEDATALHSVPVATSSVVGGVKAGGSGISIAADGTISSTAAGQMVWYGTCDTTASTAAKVVTCSGYTLQAGSIIGILFTTANTAATPTLNINSTTAKSIYVGTATPNSTTNVLKWSVNTMIYFMYDGTYYRYITSVSVGSVVPSRGANTWYGTSSTGISVQTKVSTIDNYVLTIGSLVSITFSHSNTYTSAKIMLNVNSTGAKDVYYNGAVTSSTNTLLWNANETLTFMYDGTGYQFLCKSIADVDISGKVDVTTLDDDYESHIYNNGVDGILLQSMDTYAGVRGETYVNSSMVYLDIISQDDSVSTVALDTQGVVISSQGSTGVVIHNVVTPTNNTDAVNKAYVDGLVSALTNTEIDNAVAAAVTVANGNNIQY